MLVDDQVTFTPPSIDNDFRHNCVESKTSRNLSHDSEPPKLRNINNMQKSDLHRRHFASTCSFLLSRGIIHFNQQLKIN
ncbi:hypothetical transcript [Echinococcus multilocularis]|uniref:Hypothetical transcript n=1 Tax=Echinococcus multilocularis TaxID=6211 RepID=A0A068XZJ2_ECHMU|nr:hypothetical transcript [Echinococcus multilocularis]